MYCQTCGNDKAMHMCSNPVMVEYVRPQAASTRLYLHPDGQFRTAPVADAPTAPVAAAVPVAVAAPPTPVAIDVIVSVAPMLPVAPVVATSCRADVSGGKERVAIPDVGDTSNGLRGGATRPLVGWFFP